MRELAPIALLGLLAAVPAAGATLLVANKSEATVSFVDAASGATLATVPTGVGPHEVAVSPDGRTALVADYGGREPGSTLTLIDLDARRAARTIDLAPHRRPHGITFVGNGRALVTAEASRALLVVDVAKGAVQATLPTDAEVSHMVAASRDGSRAYVANIGSGSVTAFDLAAGKRLATIPTGEGAEGIAVTPDGAEVWVTNRDADTVSVIDAARLEVVATLDVPDFPIRAVVTPDGRRVLVTCAGSGDLAVFDRKGRELVARVPLPVAGISAEGTVFGGRFGNSSVPIGIVVAPDGHRAWVAHSAAHVISVVDLETLEKTGELKAGREPDGMAVRP